MLYSLKKHIKLRTIFHNIYKDKFFNNIIIKNNFFFYDIYRYNNLKTYISICKIRNRCILSGRSRSTFKKFKIARFCFKDLSSRGLLNGILKT